MEHPKHFDVGCRDNAENPIRPFDHHADLQIFGMRNNDAGARKSSKLCGTSSYSINHAVRIAFRGSGKERVDACKMGFPAGSVQKTLTVDVSFTQAVALSHIFHRPAASLAAGLEPFLYRLEDVHPLHHIVPGSVLGQLLGKSPDFLLDSSQCLPSCGS